MIITSRQIFDDEARKKMMRGIDELEKVVSPTLGPRGQNVALTRINPVNNEIYEFGVIDDGHLAAQQVLLKDPFERGGAELLKEAAREQVNSVGDGTTATIVLAAHIVREALKHIANGENPKALREGLREASELVKEALTKMATPVRTEKQKIEVASIASSDKIDLGPKIGSLFHKLGADGIVTVEESHQDKTEIEHQDGMQFEQGYMNPQFVTNPMRMEATLEDTYVLITDRVLNNAEEIAPIFVDLQKMGKARVVVIAQDVTTTALEFLIQNKIRGNFQALAIKAPIVADKQTEFLQDIAILTGGKLISKDTGVTYEEIYEHYGEYLGKAQRITSTKENTLIISSEGSKKAIKARIKSLKEQMPQLRSDFDKDKIRERIAKLGGGVAVIRVGAATEKEMRERKEKAIDAVAATRAAVEEGIVPGGEIALYRSRQVLASNLSNPAYKLLYDALEKPLAKLLTTSGFELGEYRYQLNQAGKNFGIDVTDGVIKDMYLAGIVDPVKVPKGVLDHAVSVANLVITTGVEITHEGKEVKYMAGANE